MEYMHNNQTKLLHSVCEHFIIKYEILVFYPQIALQKASMNFILFFIIIIIFFFFWGE